MDEYGREATQNVLLGKNGLTSEEILDSLDRFSSPEEHIYEMEHNITQACIMIGEVNKLNDDSDRVLKVGKFKKVLDTICRHVIWNLFSLNEEKGHASNLEWSIGTLDKWFE